VHYLKRDFHAQNAASLLSLCAPPKTRFPRSKREFREFADFFSKEGELE
jgi:hypothetical protein